jgi:uncharacterized protein YlxW (UPF0749 family)
MGEAIPVVVHNLTPTFWSVCVLIVIVLSQRIKSLPTLDRQKRDGDASLRADLMKMLTDERRRCDEELHALRQQVEGLQRMIIQFSTSSGRAIELGKVPEAAKSIPRVEEHLARREGEEK